MSYTILLGMSIVGLLMLMFLMKQELRDIKQEIKYIKNREEGAKDVVYGLMDIITDKGIATPVEVKDFIVKSARLTNAATQWKKRGLNV